MRYFLLMLALLAPAAHAQTVEQDGSKDSYSMATERAQNTFFAYQGALEAGAPLQQPDTERCRVAGL